MTGFVPLQLSAPARALLNDLAFLGAEGRLLHPFENDTALTLEAMGLAVVAADLAASQNAGWGAAISQATITAAGRRVVKGPCLATRDGARHNQPGTTTDPGDGAA